MADQKLYADRRPWDLEPHYSAHVMAMTAEDLHSKADIAAELAFRDKEIERLCAEALKVSDIQDALDPDETETLILLEEKIARYRRDAGKRPLECVVVESDWPEYEPTWQAIEDRVIAEQEKPAPQQEG